MLLPHVCTQTSVSWCHFPSEMISKGTHASQQEEARLTCHNRSGLRSESKTNGNVVMWREGDCLRKYLPRQGCYREPAEPGPESHAHASTCPCVRSSSLPSAVSLLLKLRPVHPRPPLPPNLLAPCSLLLTPFGPPSFSLLASTPLGSHPGTPKAQYHTLQSPSRKSLPFTHNSLGSTKVPHWVKVRGWVGSQGSAPYQFFLLRG